MFKTIIAVLIVTVVVLIVMSVLDKATSSTPGDVSTASSIKDADSLQITITGEVNHTGVYYLPLNSKLSDLLDAASGTTSNADIRAYNTGYLLLNKQSFYIAPIFDNSDVCATTALIKVNINVASKSALAEVAAFSSSVAEAIVSYRQANGVFERIEDLKNVSGIGNATFEKCKNYVILHD